MGAQPEKTDEHHTFSKRYRFLLLVLVVCCLTINWSNILTFSFTVICMSPKNGTQNVSMTDWKHREFTGSEKSQAIGVVAAGALIANPAIVILINRYGPRYLFTAVGLFGAIATALVPLALNYGFNWFLAVRVMQGVAFAGDMATFGHFVTYWTYYKQYAFFTATLCAYVQFAPVFTDPVSGIICESSFGWPGVYYFHAIVAAILFTAFFIAYRNDPKNHPWVSNLEKGKLGRGKETPEQEMRKYIPYKDILRSSAAWAVFIGAIGNFAGINLIFQFAPTYLSKMQGFEVVTTGFYAALPPLLEAVAKVVSGVVNDRIPTTWMSETIKTKVRTNIGGFYKSGSMIAGPYAPFVLGHVSTAMTLTMLLVPLLVNFLTPTNTREQWASAFMIIGLIMVACNVFVS
ncbi:major facilitator superfamily domain-containing protein [Ditylenchus destructor]|nr:major facilitator superfamily domain-containing protein [Ditylenchus destructor]